MKLIIYTIVSLTSTFGFSYLYFKFSNCYKIKFTSILVFIIGVVIITLVKYFSVPVISNIIFFMYYPILFYTMESKTFKSLVYYTLIIWCCGIILDFLTMLILSSLNHFNLVDLTNDIYKILPSMIVFIIFLILGNIKLLSNFINKLVKSLCKLKYFDILLVIFICFVFCIGTAITINIHYLNIEFLLIIISYLILLLFVLIIDKKISTKENKIFLKLLKENNEFYLKIEDENRIFKHNLIAKLLSIKSVSDKKARVLIDDFIKDFNSNMDFSMQIKDMPYGLNGIIYEKVYPYIGKLNIKINNQIDFDIFKRLRPRRYNVFVEKMIIALDNAIEASLESYDKLLIIDLYFENNEIHLEIKNTFASSISLEDIGNINYSTKNKEKTKRRGLGLFSALRDNEVSMKIKIINQLFIIQIIAKQNLEESQ